MVETIPTVDDVIHKDVVRRARIRYYSEHLSLKIGEIEKLREEAIKIQDELIKLEKEEV